MIFTNESIQQLSTEDYIFLTENFRLADKDTTRDCVAFLLYNKRKKLVDTVKKVVENELTSDEQNITLDYWVGNLSIGDMTKKYNISRASLYRTLDVIKEKLNTSLKYVMIYNDEVKPPSTEEFLRQFKGEVFLNNETTN